LNKHWAAHKLGLTEWRLEWPQWKHYTAGVEQYRDEFKDNGTLTNWN